MPPKTPLHAICCCPVRGCDCNANEVTEKPKGFSCVAALVLHLFMCAGPYLKLLLEITAVEWEREWLPMAKEKRPDMTDEDILEERLDCCEEQHGSFKVDLEQTLGTSQLTDEQRQVVVVGCPHLEVLVQHLGHYSLWPKYDFIQQFVFSEEQQLQLLQACRIADLPARKVDCDVKHNTSRAFDDLDQWADWFYEEQVVCLVSQRVASRARSRSQQAMCAQLC
jgi:hypothetical protein